MLGTFVEISARMETSDGESERSCQVAVDRAFARMDRVQQLMSAHEPTSELSRLNRDAAVRPVAVSEETHQVLEHGLELARESNGAFDFTVAGTLARWGYLPAELRRTGNANWRDVRLLRGRRVRFRTPLAIDLGGIAKGYAVDQAIDALRSAGVQSAHVNAGGDLRTFGEVGLKVGLRHPVTGHPLAEPLYLQEEALATSSPFFTQKGWRGQTVSHLVDPFSRRPVAGAISISIRAAHAWIADALTKVLMNLEEPKAAERVLDRYGASALVLTS